MVFETGKCHRIGQAIDIDIVRVRPQYNPEIYTNLTGRADQA